MSVAQAQHAQLVPTYFQFDMSRHPGPTEQPGDGANTLKGDGTWQTLPDTDNARQPGGRKGCVTVSGCTSAGLQGAA